MNLKLKNKKRRYILILVFMLFVVGTVSMVDLSAANQGSVILMYHNLVPQKIYETVPKYQGNKYTMPVEKFEKQMAYLKAHGYHTMLMSEAAKYIYSGENLPNKTVIITFDDGYESNYVYAYPILKKYGIKANIAVMVKSSMNAVSHANDFDPTKNTHLTFDEMKEMLASGLVEIGSHSYDGHGMLQTNWAGFKGKFYTTAIYDPVTHTKESHDEYLQRINHDLALSKSVLEQKLGSEIVYFAYPYGATNESVIKAVQDNGFKMAVSVKPGKVGKNADAFLLRRYNINPAYNIEDFQKIIENSKPFPFVSAVLLGL